VNLSTWIWQSWISRKPSKLIVIIDVKLVYKTLKEKMRECNIRDAKFYDNMFAKWRKLQEYLERHDRGANWRRPWSWCGWHSGPTGRKRWKKRRKDWTNGKTNLLLSCWSKLEWNKSSSSIYCQPKNGTWMRSSTYYWTNGWTKPGKNCKVAPFICSAKKEFWCELQASRTSWPAILLRRMFNGSTCSSQESQC